MSRLVAVAAALWLLVAAPAPAQVSTATPIFHGKLLVRGSGGSVNNSTGIGTLGIRRWPFSLADGSNGIFPGQEPVVVAIQEESYLLPAGSLTPSRNGRVFRYRAPTDAGPRAIRSFRIAGRGTHYKVSFSLIGLDLSPLVLNTPVCMPMAVIVGDDDGFTGALVAQPGFHKHVLVRKACDVNSWPWIK